MAFLGFLILIIWLLIALEILIPNWPVIMAMWEMFTTKIGDFVATHGYVFAGIFGFIVGVVAGVKKEARAAAVF